MKELCNLTPEQLTLYATSIAIELVKNKSADELCALRTLLSQISATLCTLLAHEGLCRDRRKRCNDCRPH